MVQKLILVGSFLGAAVGASRLVPSDRPAAAAAAGVFYAWNATTYERLVIGHWTLRGYGWWAVEDRRTGDFLGRIGLYNPEGWPGIEVGWLLRRDVWGAGLATEGATAALTFAFDVVGAGHVISIIDARNARSIRVAEKIGERYERDLRHKDKAVVVYGTNRPVR